MIFLRQEWRTNTNIYSGYVLKSIEGNKLQSSTVDPDPVRGLQRLVQGRISKVADILAAENAIRAIVLHDNPSCVVPVTRIQKVSDYDQIFKHIALLSEYESAVNHGYHELISPHTICSETKDFLSKANLEILHATIDDVVGVDGIKIAKSIEDKSKLESQELMNEKLLTGKGRIFSPPESKFKIVSLSEAEYLKDVLTGTPALQNYYLNPIRKSGSTMYLSNYDYRNNSLEIQNNISRMFFKELDSNWAHLLSVVAPSIQMALPLFTSIILRRAPSRECIFETVLELRNEHHMARKGFWEHIDNIDMNANSTREQYRVAIQLQKEAGEILRNQLKGDQYMDAGKLSVDFLGRFLEILATACIAPISAIPAILKDSYGAIETLSSDGFKKLTRLETTKHLTRETKFLLEQKELGKLLSKHLTSDELDNLYIDLTIL